MSDPTLLEMLVRRLPYSTILLLVALVVIRRDLLIDAWEVVKEYLFIIKMKLYLSYMPDELVAVGILAIAIMLLVLCDRGLQAFKIHREQQQRHAAILSKERDVLMEIFEGLEGFRWKDRSRWGGSEEVRRWKGVKVNRSGRVNKLILPENNLRGVLSPSIGQLEDLIEIDFRDNYIGGEIPFEALKKLRKLGGLYLFSNNFHGKIDIELAHLPPLRGIYLFNNNLEGKMIYTVDYDSIDITYYLQIRISLVSISRSMFMKNVTFSFDRDLHIST